MGENHDRTDDDGGLKGYITRHMLIGIVLAVVVIVALKMILGFIGPIDSASTAVPGREEPGRVAADAEASRQSHAMGDDSSLPAGHIVQTPEGSDVLLSRDSEPIVLEKTPPGSETSRPRETLAKADAHAAPQTSGSETAPQPKAASHSADKAPAPAHASSDAEAGGHDTGTNGAGEAETPSFPVRGMAFVDAVIRPLDYELNQRFYGWRPNDILDVTDNVNNFQLGVLEVTRRTAVSLAERISRTGSTASFDSSLQNAMNWLMIKADRYWFPSAESKYKASLKEIRSYFHKLEIGEAQFYSRTDNLIPLLMAYEDLLGSCDENLVKPYEDDGSPVSYFKSDDYFFYARGVTSAMVTVLEGVEKDFNIMVSREGGMEVLHHAIASCYRALEIDPWLILNSDLSSVFANHRLNMAAPVSHARFYLGVLIKALST